MVDGEKVLNSQQLEAIKYGKGPLLIIAGAGTGKTTVITERIKYLISSKLAKASEILALTFTEKAALEMEGRVDEAMPYGYIQMWISTFHSFCDRILRDEALHIGLDSHYILMTQAETLLFLRKRLFKFDLDYFRPAGNPNKFLNGLLNHFNRLKDEDILPENYLVYAKKLQAKLQISNSKFQTEKDNLKKTLELAKAYQKYEELKIKEGMMDFADLIANVLRIFRSRKNILRKYQKQFKYILVDEFQDTNMAQYELVKLLGFPQKKPNLTVVGDDSQSIYKFRGAAVSNILSFKDDYPQAEMITLIKNYRSTQAILNSAYKLIKHNDPDTLEHKLNIDKNLISTRKINGRKINVFFTDRVENEADETAKEIKRIVQSKKSSLIKGSDNYRYGDIAILVRANNHANPFIRAFLRNGVPFQFLGPGRLLRQEEIKDLIAYLRLLYNFEDNVAFFRILSLTMFDISARDIAAIRNFARKFNFSLFEAAEQIDKILVAEISKKKITKIVKMVYRHLKLAAKETAGQILYYFLEDSGMLQRLTEFKTVKEEQKANNIAKFFDKLKTYEAEHKDAGIEAVVDWLNLKLEMGESSLASDIDWTKENKVNILTVHSAKGLEFPVVFLVNLVSERFPTRRRREQIPVPDQLIKESLPQGSAHEQEERRLFYVGMTRAEDLLYFTAAKFYGEGKRLKKISPFVFEAIGEKAFKGQQLKAVSHQLSILDFKPRNQLNKFLRCTAEESLSISHHQSFVISYLSYSQIETFNKCPLQYKFKYILRIPTPCSAAASFGTSIHQSLKDFYQQILAGKSVQKKDFLKILKNCWKKEGYASKDHEKKMYMVAKEFLFGFFDKGYRKEEKPIALEQAFIIKINPFLKIGGRIDRVDKLKNGAIEIIDYKTGKVPSLKEVNKNLQLSFYALAANNPGIYNQAPKNVLLSFYFLKEQKKISLTKTKKDLIETKEEIIKKAAEMEKSEFLARPSPLCDFCDYKLLCPVWK